jgi:Cd2+/Zn2+-exporting ATPase
MLKNLAKGRLFDENFLMTTAALGAVFIGETAEAAAVLLFYQAGIFLENVAVARSRGSIDALLSIRPETANLPGPDGGTVTVPAASVAAGSLVIVRPGEIIPIDGAVIEGSSSVDTASLTGEPILRNVSPGDKVLAGFINGSGALTMKTDSLWSESTAARIVETVRAASENKAKAESFISRFARVYTPIVTAAAFLIAVLPPALLPGASLSEWIYRAVTFLVVSCPAHWLSPYR